MELSGDPGIGIQRSIPDPELIFFIFSFIFLPGLGFGLFFVLQQDHVKGVKRKIKK